MSRLPSAAGYDPRATSACDRNGKVERLLPKNVLK
jgi:hypothetical protein